MITPILEQKIWEGKARYETRAFAVQAHNLIEVPENSFIVVLGYDFEPAQITTDNNSANVKPGLHRVEFFDGKDYSFHFHKISGPSNWGTDGTSRTRQSQKPFHPKRLYKIYDADLGITVSLAPDIELQNIGPFDNTKVSNLVNNGTNTQQDVQIYQDTGGNLQGSVLNNQLAYGLAYSAGVPQNLDFNNFNFEDTSSAFHYYSFVGNGGNYTQDDGIWNMWTMVVHYVRVFESRPESLI